MVWVILHQQWAEYHGNRAIGQPGFGPTYSTIDHLHWAILEESDSSSTFLVDDLCKVFMGEDSILYIQGIINCSDALI